MTRRRASVTSAIAIAAVMHHGSPAAASPFAVDAALFDRAESPSRGPSGLRPPQVDDETSDDAARREAAAAFADGEAAFERGEYSLAAGRFERAHRLSPHSWTLYNLALSRARGGDALGAFQAFDELAERAQSDDERREAEGERDALLPLLGVIVVRGPVGSRACIDGVSVEIDRDPVRRVVGPGAHRVATPERDAGVVVEPGATIEVRAASPVASRDRIRPWLAVAAAAGTLATGAAIGGAVLADDRTAQALAGSAAVAGAAATTAVIVALVRRGRERKAARTPWQCAPPQNRPTIDTPPP